MFSPSIRSDLQVSHEPAGGKPEIVPHHHDRLNMLAVAVTKSGDQFGVFLAPLGVQPLLKLIQNQQHLYAQFSGCGPFAGVPANRRAPILEAVEDILYVSP